MSGISVKREIPVLSVDKIFRPTNKKSLHLIVNMGFLFIQLPLSANQWYIPGSSIYDTTRDPVHLKLYILEWFYLCLDREDTLFLSGNKVLELSRTLHTGRWQWHRLDQVIFSNPHTGALYSQKLSRYFRDKHNILVLAGMVFPGLHESSESYLSIKTLISSKL